MARAFCVYKPIPLLPFPKGKGLGLGQLSAKRARELIDFLMLLFQVRATNLVPFPLVLPTSRDESLARVPTILVLLASQYH